MTEHPPAAMIASAWWQWQWHLLGAAIALWAFQGSTSHLPTRLRTLGIQGEVGPARHDLTCSAPSAWLSGPHKV